MDVLKFERFASQPTAHRLRTAKRAGRGPTGASQLNFVPTSPRMPMPHARGGLKQFAKLLNCQTAGWRPGFALKRHLGAGQAPRRVVYQSSPLAFPSPSPSGR